MLFIITDLNWPKLSGPNNKVSFVLMSPLIHVPDITVPEITRVLGHVTQ